MVISTERGLNRTRIDRSQLVPDPSANIPPERAAWQSRWRPCHRHPCSPHNLQLDPDVLQTISTQCYPGQRVCLGISARGHGAARTSWLPWINATGTAKPIKAAPCGARCAPRACLGYGTVRHQGPHGCCPSNRQERPAGCDQGARY
jgi:hypothetical protein